MSQTFDIPPSAGASRTTAFAAIMAALATLRTTFSGASRPSSPVLGQFAVVTGGATPTLDYYDGTTWHVVCPDLSAATGAGLLALAGGTMQGDVDMDGNAITGLPMGQVAGDAAEMSQVNGRIHETLIPLGSRSATFSHHLKIGGQAITVVDVILMARDATAPSSGTWSFQVANSTGPVNLRSAGYDADGDDLKGAPVALGLDQNLSVAAGDVLTLTGTKTGSPGDLTDLSAMLRFTVATPTS